jgi:hypothetical protein
MFALIAMLILYVRIDCSTNMRTNTISVLLRSCHHLCF